MTVEDFQDGYYKEQADWYYDKWQDALRAHDGKVDEIIDLRLELQNARNDVHAAMTCAEMLFEFMVTELDPDPSDMLRDYLPGDIENVWEDLEARYGHGQ